MKTAVYRGVVRGGRIVLVADDPPLTEGTEVLVTPVAGARGTPAAALAAVEGSPRVPVAWLDELERLIAEGRRPPTYSDPFAEDPSGELHVRDAAVEIGQVHRRAVADRVILPTAFGGRSMTLPDFLTRYADGYIHVAGHRIGLQDVVYYYNEGYSPEALLEAFPTLSLALIHKLIAFYLEQTADVDAYVATCEQDVERQRAAVPRGPDVVELRRRRAVGG